MIPTIEPISVIVKSSGMSLKAIEGKTGPKAEGR